MKNVIAADACRDLLRPVRSWMQARGAVDTLDAGQRATLHGLLEKLRPAIERGGSHAWAEP
ncbi:hypothetical protein [Streptomyces sp. SID13726]|uniref:hypothetical protein n=1 Tax=Streptomyces sp. SID13726 TaxID=2706058 RepID=UPI0013BE3454|nr:hypothetical protein [Streptomyces sp. SID13726]NEA99019.1 hypothetical protein [Streptomyces sp. SID13726]